MKLRKTHAPTSWAALSHDQRDLLTRLCLESLDGLWLLQLTVADRRVADALLERRLVEWREAILRVSPEGLALFVRESGLISKAVG